MLHEVLNVSKLFFVFFYVSKPVTFNIDIARMF